MARSLVNILTFLLLGLIFGMQDVPHSQNHNNSSENNAIQVLTPDSLSGKLELFARLTSTLPRDQHGFLQRMLNHALIPDDFDSRPTGAQDKILASCGLPISMLEGYHSFAPKPNRQDPTPTPLPVWNQLPFEPESYHQLFRRHLQSSARSLAEAAENLPSGISEFSLHEAYVFFYWAERARSYDILRPVAAAKLRDQRLMQMEDDHFRLSNRVLGELVTEMDHRAAAQEGRPWAGMKATEIIASLSTMVGMQRVALGMPANGPKIKNEGYIPAPFAGNDRHIKESTANYAGAVDNGTSQAQDMRLRVERAMASDPKVAFALQEAAMAILMKVHEDNPDNQS